QTIVAASAIPPSTGTSSAPVTSLVAISVTSPANTLSGTSAPAAGLDWATIGATSSQQAGGTALSNASVAAASQDLLAASGAPSTIAGAIGTPEQNPTLNPALPFGIAPAANAANLSVLTGVASPLPLAPNTASPIDRTDQTPANAGAARETDPALIALPAQIKFAASARATDDSPSDSSPDAWLASAASSGDTTRNTSDQPGAIQPSFNPTILTAVQATPGVSPAPQHTAIIPDAVPLAGIPIAIPARVEAGEKRFEIRLDPPDLGRIEVTLNVDSSGRATSHLVVDRADTLDLLRRDAPALERALQSAGLTTGDGALQFSLRDQSFAGRD